MNGINRAGLVLIIELTSLNQPEPDSEEWLTKNKYNIEKVLHILLDLPLRR